ncbi:hypothetical protein JCM10212_003878 [Sporobolomyces blumeae]
MLSCESPALRRSPRTATPRRPHSPAAPPAAAAAASPLAQPPVPRPLRSSAPRLARALPPSPTLSRDPKGKRRSLDPHVERPRTTREETGTGFPFGRDSAPVERMHAVGHSTTISEAGHDEAARPAAHLDGPPLPLLLDHLSLESTFPPISTTPVSRSGGRAFAFAAPSDVPPPPRGASRFSSLSRAKRASLDSPTEHQCPSKLKKRKVLHDHFRSSSILAGPSAQTRSTHASTRPVSSTPTWWPWVLWNAWRLETHPFNFAQFSDDSDDDGDLDLLGLEHGSIDPEETLDLAESPSAPSIGVAQDGGYLAPDEEHDPDTQDALSDGCVFTVTGQMVDLCLPTPPPSTPVPTYAAAEESAIASAVNKYTYLSAAIPDTRPSTSSLSETIASTATPSLVSTAPARPGLRRSSTVPVIVPSSAIPPRTPTYATTPTTNLAGEVLPVSSSLAPPAAPVSCGG